MITENVRYTERPGRVDYFQLPTGEVDLFMRKNIAEEETEEGVCYTADEAYMRMPTNDPTQAEVIENFDTWYAVAAAWEKPQPVPEPTVEERLATVEAENLVLKGQLENAMEALDFLIMEG